MHSSVGCLESHTSLKELPIDHFTGNHLNTLAIKLLDIHICRQRRGIGIFSVVTAFLALQR